MPTWMDPLQFLNIPLKYRGPRLEEENPPQQYMLDSECVKEGIVSRSEKILSSKELMQNCASVVVRGISPLPSAGLLLPAPRLPSKWTDFTMEIWGWDWG